MFQTTNQTCSFFQKCQQFQQTSAVGFPAPTGRRASGPSRSVQSLVHQGLGRRMFHEKSGGKQKTVFSTNLPNYVFFFNGKYMVYTFRFQVVLSIVGWTQPPGHWFLTCSDMFWPLLARSRWFWYVWPLLVVSRLPGPFSMCRLNVYLEWKIPRWG